MTRALAGRAAAIVAAASLAVATAVPAVSQIPVLQDERGLPSLSELVERVTPAVVNISVLASTPAPTSPLLEDPFFREFFNLPPPDAIPPRRTLSAGSGVIVDARRGLVLTNAHVIQDADVIVVTLKDGRRLEATLVGSDPPTDIALLRIEADDLTALPMGDSDALEVGDFVIAIGNPFGIGQTVTSGLVSALGRSGINPEGYESFIQTDAPINPGNSGGALVALDGTLVGINSAILAPSAGNVGIGFAVPSNMARAVMEQLVTSGEVRRGRLGVSIHDVTPDIADAVGLDRVTGAVVAALEPGGPAARAGLRAGDVVIAVNREPVASSSELKNRLGFLSPGSRVELTVLRDGRRRTIEARLEEAPSQRSVGRR